METLADAAATRGEAKQIGWASFTTVVCSPGGSGADPLRRASLLTGGVPRRLREPRGNQHETGVLASFGETTCWATLDRR